MTFTWIRDASAKEKPTAPNNPIFGFECKIPISLVYKGPKYKRCSGVFWRYSNEHGNQSVFPEWGQALPPTAPGSEEGGMKGRMEGWEPGKFRLSHK